MRTKRIFLASCLLFLAWLGWPGLIRAEEIHNAANAGNMEKVKALLDANPGLVNATDDMRRTPLHFAANIEVAELLLGKGAQIDAKDNGGETPLSRAAGHGHKDVVELLLGKGADVNAKDKWEETPLFGAVSNDSKDVVELLLGKGADVNAKNKFVETPLFKAVSKEVAELLLAKGAEVNAKAVHGQTPLHAAASDGRKEIVELLLRKGADVNARDDYEGETPLFEVARSLPANSSKDHSFRDIAELLFAKGAKINARDKIGRTPLHCVVNIEMAEWLLGKGAQINAKDDGGKTPLFHAAINDHKDVAEWLLSKGADVNARDNGGETALFRAADYGHTDVVELLLGKGAEVNAKDDYGKTALFRTSDKEVAALLVARGADINAKNNDGETALFSAAYFGYKDVVELLLGKGAEVIAANKSGETPLQVAEKEGKTDVAELLRQPTRKAADEALEEGIVAAGQQQWTVAIRHFLKAQAARPTAPEVLFNLGLAESKGPGRELRAMAWLQAYLLAAPDAANAAAVRTEIAQLKVRVEGALEKLAAQAKQQAGQFSDDGEREKAFCAVATAQARTGDTEGAIQTLRRVGVESLAKGNDETFSSVHYKGRHEYKPRDPLPTTAKERLEELLRFVKEDLGEELFTDPQSALQTIATKPEPIVSGDTPLNILLGLVNAIEQLADDFNDLKLFKP